MYHRKIRRTLMVPLISVAVLVVAACGVDRQSAEQPERDSGSTYVVATTGVWADVLSNITCDEGIAIRTLLPEGSDPHSYEPSLRDRQIMQDAALVVANGLELEEGLLDTLAAAAESGTPVLRVGELMTPIPYTLEGSSDHDTEAAHGHGADDPHVWLDPTRVAKAVPALAEALVGYAGADSTHIEGCVLSYVAELNALHETIQAQTETLRHDHRKLVTNHDNLGYFADRYNFEIIGTVLPSVSAVAQTNASHLERLAQQIENSKISAIFADATLSDKDIQSLADRLGEVEVVVLYTGGLGPLGSDADTYIGYMQTNVRLIVEALGGN